MECINDALFVKKKKNVQTAGNGMGLYPQVLRGGEAFGFDHVPPS